MIKSGMLFDAVALPYALLTRHPVWERHCARMAAELPTGAEHILDLGCGPGNSTAHLGPGAIGGDCSLAMLRRARPRGPRMKLARPDAGSRALRAGARDARTLHTPPDLLPGQPRASRRVRRGVAGGAR